MESIIQKKITSMMLILIGLGSYAYAESVPNLPTSTQINGDLNESLKIDEIEIVPEITIQAENTKNRNPNLKEGEACDDENLDPAKLSPDEFQDIPMAKTIPCDKVNCEDLKPAKLLKDTYKKIPMAKTIKLKPCKKK
jgi:hypothetical protein